MEDPIEFVHQSKSCLVNQRELGSHTTSFTRALRAALREDPDVVLVGELRDLETVSLALEIANTGHLVFGTLHTTTAIGTIERIVEMFPHDEQTLVRAVLADTLIGVVAQTLCRRKGGGRVGIYEILVGSSAVSNCIREGKGHQITSLMQTGKTQGNTLLNEELARNVREGIVEESEALSKTVDKKDLEKRLAQH
jgi:twitching motility protein PilT